MITIVLYQSLSTSAMYEHRFLENIKKIYKSSGKCDDQQQYKAIIEASNNGSIWNCTLKSQLLLGIFKPNFIFIELVFPWYFLHTFYFLQKFQYLF